MTTRTLLASKLSRRGCFGRLAAAGLALPLLSQRSAAAATPPKRFLVLFSPNGTILQNWKPTGTDRQFELSRILKPLDPFKSQLMVLENIVHQSAGYGPGDDHMKGMAHWLTGIEMQAGAKGAALAGGPSIDQVVAAKVGGSTRFRSLEFGMYNEMIGQYEVFTRMSYTAPAVSLPPTDNPGRMFTRVFGGGAAAPADSAELRRDLERKRLLRKSVLDSVTGELGALEKQLGADDRARVQQHLESLRDAEKRLVPNENEVATVAGGTCNPPADGTTIDLKNQANHRTVSRLQIDMIAMAFACDLTRVASLQWNRASGNAQFPTLGIRTGHHDISHAGDSDAGAVESLTKINTWYAEEAAYLLGKLAEQREADGSSVLDNTLVMWGNELCKGNAHSHSPSVPTVLAGGGAGFSMGRYVRLAKPRTNNDLYVSIQNAFGVPSDTFGNPRYCKGAIPELKV